MKEKIDTSEIESQDTLSTEEVRNEVEWVNPALKSPFGFKVGKSIKLGIFVTLEDKPKSWQLKPEEGHARSAKIGQVIFEDSQGQLYRDIDIKGMGYAAFREKRKDLVGHIAPGERPGFLNFPSALHDAQMAEILTDLGVRTHRAIAIIALEEVVDPKTQEKISVDDAKQRGLIYKNFVPVIEVRAFGTKSRLQDVSSSNNDDEKKRLVRDAKILIQREFNIIGRELSDIDYLNWIAETIAKNVAIMHKNGWLHNYLRAGHNTTLDGRIVDLDSVQSIRENPGGIINPGEIEEVKKALMLSKFSGEFMSLRAAFLDFCESFALEISNKEFKDILSKFDKSYADEYPEAWAEIKMRYNL